MGRDAGNSARQLALAIVFLPHQAWVSADAIARTLWRLWVTRRHLLEWRSASQTERGMTGSLRLVWRGMWPAVAIATVIVAGVVWREAARPAAIPLWQLAVAVLPLALAWLASPVVAYVARRAGDAPRAPACPRPRRRQALRYALLHWRFFERFVTAETNWLAPDNFQEEPAPVVAMRTSPTNIGLQLLATVSARDLGFITLDDLVRRLELVLRTLERMRRFRGHFYNWYDLRDLSVLEPGYVSTVDSGNLAGHLVALRQACLALADEPVLDSRIWPALETAVSLAAERIRPLPGATAARGAPPHRAVGDHGIATRAASRPRRWSGWRSRSVAPSPRSRRAGLAPDGPGGGVRVDPMVPPPDCRARGAGPKTPRPARPPRRAISPRDRPTPPTW